jgi:hypothetical protein
MLSLNVSEDECTKEEPCRFTGFVFQKQAGPSLLNLDTEFDWNETSQEVSFFVSEVGVSGPSIHFSQQPAILGDELIFALPRDFSGVLHMQVFVKVRLLLSFLKISFRCEAGGKEICCTNVA